MEGPAERAGEDEDLEEKAMAVAGPLAELGEAEDSLDTDLDSDQETEGIHGHRELAKDPLCLRSCQTHSLMPASSFLRQRIAEELNVRHRSLGPQGAQAVASTLAANPSIKRLDLRDNGLCGTGAEVLAAVLSKSSSICDVDLSENQLGAAGAQALCAALAENQTVQKIQLAGNCLEEQAAQHLATFLLAQTSVKSLDLSYNHLNDRAGEILGPALAENTGLTELNISWNHLRGSGATAFAKGLEANIFLKVLDISYNGFGDSGASAIGEALKTNNVLEELNLSNNRISMVGALSLGLGLQVNQTLRILVMRMRRSAHRLLSQSWFSLCDYFSHICRSMLDLQCDPRSSPQLLLPSFLLLCWNSPSFSFFPELPGDLQTPRVGQLRATYLRPMGLAGVPFPRVVAGEGATRQC